MKQMGWLDWDKRYGKIDKNGDPLAQLDRVVDWEMFRPLLRVIRDKERKSNAGARPYDVVLMFKILILQSLYNLSDDQAEYQILDRLSFMRFLGLSAGDRVPDAKTIWLFREQLKEASLIESVFSRFDEHLSASGFSARKGQIVDASLISAPIQRNRREENACIKQGETPVDWSENKLRQKDVDARWTKKNGKSYYGYKNHVSVDVEHKLIRAYAVSPANLHDSRVLGLLLDETNSSREVYADSAYNCADNLALLADRNFRPKLQRKGCRNRKLTNWERQGNRSRARIRSRVEHVFGLQAMMAGTTILRTIGLKRATLKLALRNLAYNMIRYKTLVYSG